MSETTRQRTQWGGLSAALVCLLITGWNGYVTHADTTTTGAAPSAQQVGAVALPSAGVAAGGLTALLAWLAKRRESAGASTLDLLRALSVLVDAGAGKQALALLEALKVNGFPPAGRIELTWPDQPPVGITWGKVG